MTCDQDEMMKRNVVGLIKFFTLAASTVLLTIIIFRYIRGTSRAYSTPNGLLAVTPDSLILQKGLIQPGAFARHDDNPSQDFIENIQVKYSYRFIEKRLFLTNIN